MKIVTTIRVEWERDKEKLPEFRDKYNAFKAHVLRLQLHGHMPRTDIRWVVAAAKPAIKLPGTNALQVYHRHGETLKMPFSGMYAPL